MNVKPQLLTDDDRREIQASNRENWLTAIEKRLCAHILALEEQMQRDATAIAANLLDIHRLNGRAAKAIERLKIAADLCDRYPPNPVCNKTASDAIDEAIAMLLSPVATSPDSP